MSMFQGSHGASVNGGAFHAIQGDQNIYNLGDPGASGIDILHKRTSLTALHNSKARNPLPKCYPETCVDVIDAIMAWISTVDSPDGSVLWLNCPLGFGKSAILQAIAERCTQNKRKLAASFFFSHSASDRNTDDHLVATIAYQLAHSIPGVRGALEPAVKDNPSIFDSSLKDQIEALIVQPLMKAVQALEPHSWPDVVIIDGVDECTKQATQSDIVRAICAVIREHQLPLRFIIASRPEQHLVNLFNSSKIKSVSKQISLQDRTNLKKDIEYYLRNELERIWEEGPPNARPPTERDIHTLIDKSRGQFLYPCMVIEFIGNLQRKPDNQLKVILDMPMLYHDPTSPFAEFECFYDVCGAEHVNTTLTRETLSRPYTVCVYKQMLQGSLEGLFRYLNGLSTGEIRALLQDVHAVWKEHVHRT